ncbi:HNH endonuclease signature motif containing protein [Bacillus wiedmannii]|uniref:HNH endonuclease signature motif containing protein n=1 Tax=Bacillus wiedmannii TaxID=1890302 RepID=UPI003D6480EF
MAEESRYIPVVIRRELMEEAGYKCANPGCSTRSRLELHHIKEWAVYKVHNTEDMIAICPTCHSYVHHGILEISDERLYEWKTILRNPVSTEKTDVMKIEKSMNSSMIIGPLTFKSNIGAIPFRMLDQIIEYNIEKKDLYFLNICLKRPDGTEFLSATHNVIVSNLSNEVSYNYYDSRAVIKADFKDGFLPDWAIDEIRRFDEDFAQNEVTVLDMEVIAPGTIKISNLVMVDGDAALVVNKGEIYYVVQGTIRPWIFTETFGKVPFLEKEIEYDGSDNSTIPYIDFNPRSRGKYKIPK